MKGHLHSLAALLAFVMILPSTAGGVAAGFEGAWKLDAGRSSAIDPWRTIELDIRVEGDRIMMDRRVAAGRRDHTERYAFEVSRASKLPVDMWLGNRHIGAFMGGDGHMTIRADWLDGGRTLRLHSDYTLETSQGETPVRSYTEYRLSPDGDRLTMLKIRSSRSRPILHVFTRDSERSHVDSAP